MVKARRVNASLQETLDQAVSALGRELGDNLYSCCVYGSAVRGNAVEGISDLNLLIILNESTVAAHQAVARAIGGLPQIDPFILGRRGFERSERAFATKFSSIKRNYRVLAGADPLASLKLDAELEKFLCEQAVRNLRLRLIYSFVTLQQHQAYDQFIIRNTTGIFVQLSEALRLNGLTLPMLFEARIPILEREFKIDGQVLRDLVALKKVPHKFSDDEATAWHERLFPLLDTVLGWIEQHWPSSLLK
jgi:predicted nucleotidyltransferase